ncbi:hypothetical protein HJFPF1_13642 [Paramyrothecium foliicola]|nr:hypothetical protein HJFPF1_13642 [Paramyrothecium foliicola]
MSTTQETESQNEALKRVTAFLEFHDRNDKQKFEFGKEPKAEREHYNKRFVQSSSPSELLHLVQIANERLKDSSHFVELKSLCLIKVGMDVESGRLASLQGLSEALKFEVVNNMTPSTRLWAAEKRIVELTPAQDKHARLWEMIIGRNAWYHDLLHNKGDAFIIGPDLDDKPEFIVLITIGGFGLDSGDIVKNLRIKKKHEYDKRSGEVTLENDCVVNVWQPMHHSGNDTTVPIDDLDQRLKHILSDGSARTYMLHYRKPQLYRMVYRPSGGRNKLKGRLNLEFKSLEGDVATIWRFADSLLVDGIDNN